LLDPEQEGYCGLKGGNLQPLHKQTVRKKKEKSTAGRGASGTPGCQKR